MSAPINSTLNFILDSPTKNGVAWDLTIPGTVVSMLLKQNESADSTITETNAVLVGDVATVSVPKTLFTVGKNWLLRWRVQQNPIDVWSPNWIPFVAK